jgi:hypothetical protein
MQVLNVTNLPIYLPYDKAPLPFGDVFDDGSATNASPAVFTAVGYVPTVGDAVGLSVDTGGALDAAFTVGTRYFVQSSPGNNTFTLSATKGGAAINSTSVSSLLAVHLLSNQVDGTTTPFKSGAVAVVLNLSGGSLTLQSAPDTNSFSPGWGQYGRPQGPGAWSTVKFANGAAGGGVVPAGSAALVQLDNDWIRVSTAATLVLQQN